MKKEKLVSLIMTGCLFTLMLAGCKANPGGKDSGTSNNQPKERTKLVFVDLAHTDKETPDMKKILDMVNDKFNVDIEVKKLPKDKAQDKLNLMLASGEQMDWFTTGGYQGWRDFKVKGDLIQPIDEALNKYGQNLKKKIPESAWKVSKFSDGKTYAVPQMGFTTKRVIMAREDWLKKLNINEPKTMDEFEGMLKAIKKADFDGNGKDDTYPLAYAESLEELKNIFLKSFIKNGFSWWEDKDGLFKPEFMDPGYKDFLTTMQKWYKEGLMHPEIFSLKVNQMQELTGKGTVGVIGAWYTRYSWEKDAQKINPDAKMMLLNPPSGPAGQGSTAASGSVVESRVIHKNSKHADTIVKIWDWSVTDEENDLLLKGIEGQHFVWKDKAKKSWDYPQGVTADNVGYNGYYTWLGLDDSVFLVNENDRGSVFRAPLMAGKYPTYEPKDFMFTYDWTGTKTKDVLNDLNTFINESEVEIITGRKPVSNWDNVLKTWNQMGGDAYIKERTEQYKKQK